MIKEEEFERLVREGYLGLPEWVRKKISNVALIIEDAPSPKERRAQKLRSDETLLGLYKGIPLSARGSEYGVGLPLPDTITIYRLPIIEAAEGDARKIPQIVADTVWHEYAHHFGMDEDEVLVRERKRDARHKSLSTISRYPV
jgi:predicted Zn-dependent protease with MMP-like domain